MGSQMDKDRGVLNVGIAEGNFITLSLQSLMDYLEFGDFFVYNTITWKNLVLH